MDLPYDIATTETLGRHLIASRDIKQGEVIMKETPMLLGSQITAFPICFKCAARINPKQSPQACDECSLAPVCGQCRGALHKRECAQMDALRSDIDGMTLEFLSENPQVCMPLRCLLTMRYDPSTWEAFLRLESHANERRGTYIDNLHRHHVDKPLRALNLFEYLRVGNSNATDVLATVCGILDVNSFEVRPPSQHFQGPEDCLRGLYVKPALMAHDCISNTHLSVDDNFVMTIRASLPIAKGEIILFSYTNRLQGNLDRQKHLKEGKYFTCACARCQDPTELQTGLSTLICPKCKQASLIYLNCQWQCPDCNKHFSHGMIRTTLSIAAEQVRKVLESGSLAEIKHVATTLRRSLHGQHSLIMEVNQKLITLLGTEESIPAALEKIVLCQQLAKVLQTLEPGISRHQGIVQYELHNANIHLGKMQYNASISTLDQYLAILQESEAILKSAIGHLIYEPKGAPEGRLAQKALTDLQVLRATIKDLEVRVQKKSKRHM